METEELSPKIQTALEKFKSDIFDNANTIDPDDDYDWKDMAYGWALGQGYTIDESFDISIYWVDWCHNDAT